MKLEDLKSGMAFETESGDFYVVSQLSIDGENHMVALFVNNRNSMDWSMLSNVPNLSIKKVYEPVQTTAGWKLIWEYQEPFTKADLKSGMRVIRRDGKDGVVFLSEDGDFISATAGETSWLWLSDYTDNLTVPSIESLDIVKVYDVHRFVTTRPLKDLAPCDIKLLWERKE